VWAYSCGVAVAAPPALAASGMVIIGDTSGTVHAVGSTYNIERVCRARARVLVVCPVLLIVPQRQQLTQCVFGTHRVLPVPVLSRGASRGRDHCALHHRWHYRGVCGRLLRCWCLRVALPQAKPHTRHQVSGPGRAGIQSRRHVSLHAHDGGLGRCQPVDVCGCGVRVVVVVVGCTNTTDASSQARSGPAVC